MIGAIGISAQVRDNLNQDRDFAADLARSIARFCCGESREVEPGHAVSVVECGGRRVRIEERARRINVRMVGERGKP